MNHNQIFDRLSHLPLFVAILTLLSPPAIAQNRIIPDESLAGERSTTTPATIQGLESDRISGGARRGANLFHSFSEFNIGENRGAYFDNPTGVENILTRVTGGVRSDILGTLGVLGDANLFLMNPSGILFGPGARLDVRGSFVGTTANAIGFGNQGQFSAVLPEVPTLLNINPSTLFFNQLNASIVSNSIAPVGSSPSGRDQFGLRVPDGESLLLIGGDVSINGGSINSGLTAQGGRIELGGLTESGAIDLDTTDTTWRSNYPAAVARSNVALTNNARVSVRGLGGGDITVNANELIATEGSVLLAGTEGAGNAGNIIVNADRIDLVGENAEGFGSGLANIVRESATGDGGNIIINADSLNITAGANLDTTTFGQGNAGNIVINASGTVSFDGRNRVLSPTGVINDVAEGAIGQGGSIEINADTLILTNNAGIQLGTFAQGNSGDVTVNAREISLQGTVLNNSGQSGSSILTRVEASGRGNAGNIRITTDTLFVLEGSALSSSTLGQGNAGNIIINAGEAVTFDGANDVKGTTGASSSVEEGAIGRGGSIEINTGTFSLLNGAQIESGTAGQGGSGDAIVNAREVNLQGTSTARDGFQLESGILTRVETSGHGNAGNIRITSNTLSVRDGAFLSSNTQGQGNAGSIVINARDAVTFDGTSRTQTSSNASSSVRSGAIGQGGSIEINTNRLSILNGAQLVLGIRGQGDGGDAIINAREVNLQGVSTTSDGRLFPSAISTGVEATGRGNAGNIRIETGTLSLRDGAVLISGTRGQGNAGNLLISASDAVTLDRGSAVSTQTGAFSSVEEGAIGQGGSIAINTGTFFLLNGAQVTSGTSGRGDGGDMLLNAREIYLQGRSIANVSSVILTRVEATGRGNAGDIRITTGTLSVRDDAFLSSSTSGQGNAGDIVINGSRAVTFDGANPLLISTGIFSTVEAGAIGRGGSIAINTDTLSLLNGSQFTSGTAGQGNGGDTIINAREINLQGNSLTVEGRIFSGILTGVDPTGRGNAGNIRIQARDRITLNDGFMATTVEPNGIGRGGDIQIVTPVLILTENASLDTTTLGQGDAGSIQIQALDRITLRGSSRLQTDTGGQGNAGNIVIQTGNLSINSRVFERRQSGIFSNVGANGVGQAGNITIRANGLTVTRGGAIVSATLGRGNAGAITIDARDRITLAGTDTESGFRSVISSNTQGGIGQAGDITIRTNELALINGGALTSATSGEGNAGAITIHARDRIILVGTASDDLIRSAILSFVDSGGRGRGGDIDITTHSFIATNGGNVSASTFGQGRAGNIRIQAGDRIRLVGTSQNRQFPSGLSSTVGDEGNGQGGTIHLTTDALTVRDRASIDASTSGQGNAGNLSIDANTVTLQNGSVASSVASGGRGNAGNIALQTERLTLQNGGRIAASVARSRGDRPAGRGNGGDITVAASDRILITGSNRNGSPSGIFARTQEATTGRAGSVTLTTNDFQMTNGGIIIASTGNDRNAGNIFINANTFSATAGGQIITNTRSSGQAGTIRLNVRDRLLLSGTDENFAARRNRAQRFITQSSQGIQLNDVLPNQGATSGLYASTEPGSIGNGGNIVLNTETATLQSGAQVTVDNQGAGQGGSILGQVNNLFLSDRAQISAETISETGGNITFNANGAIVLRDRSTISTNSRGNGGNITLNATAVVAPRTENSNITANAIAGNGGNVQLNATLYGITVADRETTNSDITASSDRGVQGEISVTPPNVNPVQGLIELPSNILDASNQISAGCPQGRNATDELGRFVTTGRGGLPASPIENLDTETVLTQWVSATDDLTPSSTLRPAAEIVEAQGWVRGAAGQVELVAEAPTTGDRALLPPIECQARSN